MNMGATTEESGTTVELRSHRMLWTSLAVVVILLSALSSLFAFGAFVGIDRWPDRLAIGSFCAVIAVGGFVFSRRALRLGRARPRFLVGTDALVVEHPGLLHRPLVIPRRDVESVCLGQFIGPRRPRPSSGGVGLFRRLRAYSRWLDSGGQFPSVSASEVLPDLSYPLYYPLGGPMADVLVVLRRPFDLGTIPRRGLGILAAEGSAYFGPTRGARIRGMLGRAVHIDDARQAFSPWGVVVERPTEEMLAWISPARPHP